MGPFSQIIRVSSGQLNTVNDTVIGGQASGMVGSTDSKFAGQLGKILLVTSEQIAQLSDSSVGTLYAGAYQYVQLASGDSPAAGIGEGVFWQGTPSSFIVSTDSNGGFTNTPTVAGIYIGGMEPGNYGFIQIAGIATVRYTSTLTVAAATGLPVIINAAGFADTNAGTNVPNFIGWSRTLPVAGSTALVNLSALLSRQF